MVTVDDVYLQSLSNKVGPSGTMKRLLKNHSFFLEQGYDVSICTPEGVLTDYNKYVLDYEHQSSKPRRNPLINLLKKITDIIEKKAPKSRFLSVLFLKIIEYREKQHLKRYLALNRHPDIIVFHSDLGCTNYLRLRKVSSSKVAVFLHSDGIPCKMEEIYFPRLKGSRYYKYLLDSQLLMAKTVDKIVYICKIGRTNYLKLYPFVSFSRTSLVVNGIEDLSIDEKAYTSEIRAKSFPKKYRMCCVGSISNRKGQMLILEAMSLMPQDILHNTELMIVGDGPDRGNCEAFVTSHNMNEMVTFTGRIPNTEVYKYLAECNIYILMSENEGLPIAILEAMRSGLAIISTNVSGIPETVDQGKTGFLLSPNNLQELKELFSTFGQYDWDEMGRSSREKFEKEFTFERMRSDYLNMLKELSN